MYLDIKWEVCFLDFPFLLQHYSVLPEGLITQEEYDEAIRNYEKPTVYDLIISNPGPVQTNDCGRVSNGNSQLIGKLP